MAKFASMKEENNEGSNFIVTTNLKTIAKMNKFIRIVQGGSSAGKTFSIVPLLMNYAIENEGKMISVVSESMPHLKRGAMRDFENIMRITGRWREGAMNKQHSTYTFSNGSKIEFFSADQPDKLRGARRNVLFVNEANNVPWESFHQMFIRTSDCCFIDFNPVAEFWAHTELKDRDDADFAILTYKGNEGCPQAAINELQRAEVKAKAGSTYWKNFVDVYVYGKIGKLTGTVYDNWKVTDNLPDSARLLGYGLDFGFSNDPSALIGFYRHNGRLILHEEVYKTGLTNSDMNSLFRSKGVSKTMPIIADSAEPKSIEELKRYGWNIKPTKKGRDSILYGISVVQAQDEMLITSSSTNLIKEFRNYTWDKDSEGNKTNKPIDKWNHALDAVRYYAMMKLNKTSEFFVT